MFFCCFILFSICFCFNFLLLLFHYNESVEWKLAFHHVHVCRNVSLIFHWNKKKRKESFFFLSTHFSHSLSLSLSQCFFNKENKRKMISPFAKFLLLFFNVYCHFFFISNSIQIDYSFRTSSSNGFNENSRFFFTEKVIWIINRKWMENFLFSNKIFNVKYYDDDDEYIQLAAVLNIKLNIIINNINIIVKTILITFRS